jgi:hypothetical protein
MKGGYGIVACLFGARASSGIRRVRLFAPGAESEKQNSESANTSIPNTHCAGACTKDRRFAQGRGVVWRQLPITDFQFTIFNFGVTENWKL